MTKIGEPIRWALAALALANIGIGLILIGIIGLGPVAYVLRDVVGGILIGLAVIAGLQAWYGKLYRIGEELLIANAGLLTFAVYQIVATSNAPQVVGAWGQSVMAVATAVGCVLLWGHLTGRRLGQEFRQAREARRKGRP